MNIVKVMLLLAAGGAAYHHWHKPDVAQDTDGATVNARVSATANAMAHEASRGFVPAAMPSGFRHGVVVVLAPENCPSEDAQRAASLASDLERKGIRVQRSSSFSAEATNPTAQQRERLNRSVAILNGPIPAVFVNGMGKSNPSVDDVVAQLQRSP